jgi:hypothetical protein
MSSPNDAKPRNDGLLFTGSAAARDITAAAKKREEERRQKRKELTPAAEVVFGAIAKEQGKLGDILLEIVNPDDNDDHVSAKLMAVRLHRKWLMDFKGEMRKLLRETPAEEAEKKKAERDINE